jgi:hypothetical protein
MNSKRIKLDTEILTDSQECQIENLIQTLEYRGYKPTIISRSATHVSLQHLGDTDDEIIKKLIVSKNGSLYALPLTEE